MSEPVTAEEEANIRALARTDPTDFREALRVGRVRRLLATLDAERAAHAETKALLKGFDDLAVPSARVMDAAADSLAGLRDRLAAVERERDEARAMARTVYDVNEANERLTATLREVRGMVGALRVARIHESAIEQILARCDAVLKEGKP